MKDFKYFKPIKELKTTGNSTYVGGIDQTALKLYNQSLTRISKYNYIEEFDEQTLTYLKKYIQKMLAEQGLNINDVEVTAGFLTNYYGDKLFDPAILLTISCQGENEECNKFVIVNSFEVGCVNGNGIEVDERLSKHWQSFMCSIYDKSYNSALRRYKNHKIYEKQKMINANLSHLFN